MWEERPNFSERHILTSISLKAHELILTIAEPRNGESRGVLIARAFSRIVRSNPTFKRWSERRVRTHLDQELANEPHRIRQMEIEDLERVAAPIKERANAAATYLLEQRARLLSASDPGLYRGQILAVEHALGAMGIVDLPGIETDRHRQ